MHFFILGLFDECCEGMGDWFCNDAFGYVYGIPVRIMLSGRYRDERWLGNS